MEEHREKVRHNNFKNYPNDMDNVKNLPVIKFENKRIANIDELLENCWQEFYMQEYDYTKCSDVWLEKENAIPMAAYSGSIWGEMRLRYKPQPHRNMYSLLTTKSSNCIPHEVYRKDSDINSCDFPVGQKSKFTKEYEEEVEKIKQQFLSLTNEEIETFYKSTYGDLILAKKVFIARRQILEERETAPDFVVENPPPL